MSTKGVGHAPPSPSRLGNFGEQVRGNRASLDTELDDRVSHPQTERRVPPRTGHSNGAHMDGRRRGAARLPGRQSPEGHEVHRHTKSAHHATTFVGTALTRARDYDLGGDWACAFGVFQSRLGGDAGVRARLPEPATEQGRAGRPARSRRAAPRSPAATARPLPTLSPASTPTSSAPPASSLDPIDRPSLRTEPVRSEPPRVVHFSLPDSGA